MQSGKLGYYIICSSPLLFLPVFYIVNYATWIIDWRIPGIVWNLYSVFFNGLQLFGLILYLTGYKKEQSKSTPSPFTGLIIMILIVGGIFFSWFMYDIGYLRMIERSSWEGMRELTFLDYLWCFSWIFNGILCFVSGVVIGLTSLWTYHKLYQL